MWVSCRCILLIVSYACGTYVFDNVFMNLRTLGCQSSRELSVISNHQYIHRENDYVTEFEYFLRGKESIRMDVQVAAMTGLSKEQVTCCVVLLCTSCMCIIYRDP